jgi:hypothetical protein
MAMYRGALLRGLTIFISFPPFSRIHFYTFLLSVLRTTLQEDNNKNISVVLGKVKVSRYTPWRGMGERRYSSYSYLTSATRWG